MIWPQALHWLRAQFWNIGSNNMLMSPAVTSLLSGQTAIYLQYQRSIINNLTTVFRWRVYRPSLWHSRIFRSSSLILHTFHLINVVFTCKYGKSTPNDRQDHHVLLVDVVIVTSQCRCTRALSQSQAAKHDSHEPVTPLVGSGTGCHIDAMAAVWQDHIGKNI